jgi:hypothetical protein
MFRKFASLSSEVNAPYLFKAYMHLGKTEKAIRLLREQQSPMGSYLLAESHLNGYVPMSLFGLFGNLSAAIQQDRKYILPILTLGPRIASSVFSHVRKCVSVGCTDEENADITKFLLKRFVQNGSLVLIWLATFSLVILFRGRIALFYE